MYESWIKQECGNWAVWVKPIDEVANLWTLWAILFSFLYLTVKHNWHNGEEETKIEIIL